MLTSSNAGRRLTPDEIETFHRDGLVIVPGFFAPRELSVLREMCDPRRALDELETEVREVPGQAYRVAIWTRLDDSLFGKLPRMPRLVHAAEALLGEPVYHWHSKLLRKRPGDGPVTMHQDYATWYDDGCLGPSMLTCSVAIHQNTRRNGCVHFVPGSHRMARIHTVPRGETVVADPDRVEALVQRFGLFYAELEPGDAVFFHSMILHASDANRAQDTRTMLHFSYNAVSNQPIARPGQEHHRYRPLIPVADDLLVTGDYTGVRGADTFHLPETEENPNAGIFVRVNPDHG